MGTLVAILVLACLAWFAVKVLGALLRLAALAVLVLLALALLRNLAEHGPAHDGYREAPAHRSVR